MHESRKKEIRVKASEFRNKCKIDRYGILDLFKDCERNGYKIVRYPMGESAALGVITKKSNDIVIVTNTSCRLSREIFTLAHEIGHAILHLNDAMASFTDTTTTISEKNNDEKEQEANYFAACLLIPVDELDKFLDLEIEDFSKKSITAIEIAKLMSVFYVSFDMALYRLENLGKIDASTRILLDNERNQLRVGNLLRSVGGNNKLNEPSKIISIPYEYLEYGIYNYNHNAIPLDTLKRMLAYYQLMVDDISDKLVEPELIEEELDELLGGLED